MRAGWKTHQRGDDPNAAANTRSDPIPNADAGMVEGRDPWPVLVRQPSNSASTPAWPVLPQTSLAFLSPTGRVGASPGIGSSFRWWNSGLFEKPQLEICFLL